MSSLSMHVTNCNGISIKIFKEIILFLTNLLKFYKFKNKSFKKKIKNTNIFLNNFI